MSIKEHIPAAGLLLTIFAIIGGVWAGIVVLDKFSEWRHDVEERLYDNSKQKYKEEQHVDEFDLSLKEMRRQSIKRDSMAQIFLKGVARIDSLTERSFDMSQRQAVSEYQAKKNTDSIIKLWNDYNESVENN